MRWLAALPLLVLSACSSAEVADATATILAEAILTFLGAAVLLAVLLLSRR